MLINFCNKETSILAILSVPSFVKYDILFICLIYWPEDVIFMQRNLCNFRNAVFYIQVFCQDGKMSIYKAFVRPHLNYGDVNYDKALQPNISSET